MGIELESRLKSKEESKSIAELIVEARSDIIDLCASDDENNSCVLVNMRKKDLTVEVSDILKIKSSLLTRDDQASVLSYLKSQESSVDEETEKEKSESSENIELESRLKSNEESKSIAELIVEARSDIIDL